MQEEQRANCQKATAQATNCLKANWQEPEHQELHCPKANDQEESCQKANYPEADWQGDNRQRVNCNCPKTNVQVTNYRNADYPAASRQKPKPNYQKELDHTLERISRGGEVPSLLLHSCCAPCSSYVLEYLSGYFAITVFYYNPNIWPEEEYYKRVEEQRMFVSRFPTRHPVSFLEGNYDTERFYEMARGLEQVPEGGERCFRCYELRLRETAAHARALGMDYFTTTLSLSPLKNAAKLNEIGLALAEEYGVAYLVSDFKKKDGFKRSVELSREYGIYRQDYCGCVFSKRQREEAVQKEEAKEKEVKEKEVKTKDQRSES